MASSSSRAMGVILGTCKQVWYWGIQSVPAPLSVGWEERERISADSQDTGPKNSDHQEGLLDSQHLGQCGELTMRMQRRMRRRTPQDTASARKGVVGKMSVVGRATRKERRSCTTCTCVETFERGEPRLQQWGDRQACRHRVCPWCSRWKSAVDAVYKQASWFTNWRNSETASTREPVQDAETSA